MFNFVAVGEQKSVSHQTGSEHSEDEGPVKERPSVREVPTVAP